MKKQRVTWCKIKLMIINQMEYQLPIMSKTLMCLSVMPLKQEEDNSAKALAKELLEGLGMV